MLQLLDEEMLRPQHTWRGWSSRGARGGCRGLKTPVPACCLGPHYDLEAEEVAFLLLWELMRSLFQKEFSGPGRAEGLHTLSLMVGVWGLLGQTSLPSPQGVMSAGVVE